MSYIYESPDGGKTVYARKPSETVRHLHWVDPKYLKEKELCERWERLKPVVYLADTDTGLNELLTKLEMLYALKK